MAWRSSSASVCMSGLHFASAASCSRLPVAVAGTAPSPPPSLSPSDPPQPVSASTAAAAAGRASVVSTSSFLRSCRRSRREEPRRALPSIRLRAAVLNPPVRLTGTRYRPGHGCARVAPVNEDWEERVTAAWATLRRLRRKSTAADFRAVIDALVAELPAGQPPRPLRAGLRLGLDRPLRPGGPAVPGGARPGPRARLQGPPREDPALQFAAEHRAGRGGRQAAHPRTGRLPPTSWTTRCGPVWRCACPASAATARACPWSSAPWPPICRATSGRWRTTRALLVEPRGVTRGPGSTRVDDGPVTIRPIRSFC